MNTVHTSAQQNTFLSGSEMVVFDNTGYGDPSNNAYGAGVWTDEDIPKVYGFNATIDQIDFTQYVGATEHLGANVHVIYGQQPAYGFTPPASSNANDIWLVGEAPGKALWVEYEHTANGVHTTNLVGIMASPTGTITDATLHH